MISHQDVAPMECFNLSSGYIIKELTILIPDDSYEHFQFNPPNDFNPTAAQTKTIKYIQKHLNELTLYENALLPYSIINDIMKKISSHTIFVAGNITQNVINEYLPLSKVIDICTEYKFSYPKELPPANCFKQHKPRYCSMAKTAYVKKFMNSLNNKGNF